MKVERHYLRYIDYAQNHNKFYQVFITKHGVMLNYGRISSEGQTKWHPASSWEEAAVFARKKLFEKLDKGYYEDGEPVTYEIDEFHPTAPPGLYRLKKGMHQGTKAAGLTDTSGDLANQAEAFASKVIEVVNSVKKGETDPDVILASIADLDHHLRRAETAVENAKLGLEMARTALGQRMQMEEA